MKVYSLTFSPTGTSGKIGSAVAGAIGEPNHIDLTMEPRHRIEFAADDVVVISAPVYGGHIAPLARKRFEAVVKANGASAVVVAVYGNRAFEKAVADLATVARECGFRVIGAGAFVGEHSYSTAACPIAAGRPDSDDLASAAGFGRSVAEKLCGGNVAEVDASQLSDLPVSPESVANFRSFVAAYQQQRKANPVKAVPEVDESKCTACGICVELCPPGALTAGDSRADAELCIRCCACVKGCPEGARRFDSPFAPVLSQNFGARKAPLWIVGETS